VVVTSSAAAVSPPAVAMTSSTPAVTSCARLAPAIETLCGGMEGAGKGRAKARGKSGGKGRQQSRVNVSPRDETPGRTKVSREDQARMPVRGPARGQMPGLAEVAREGLKMIALCGTWETRNMCNLSCGCDGGA
jgi:hypothetical protein